MWDLHPPAWRMKPDWNFLQRTREWVQRQDSNLHLSAYETVLEPFQTRMHRAWGPGWDPMGGHLTSRVRRPAGAEAPARKTLPVGDTDGPECQSVRTPGLEASGRGASLRQQMVDPDGLEPSTSSVQTRRSSAELGAQNAATWVAAVGCYGSGVVKDVGKRRTPAWDQAGVPEEEAPAVRLDGYSPGDPGGGCPVSRPVSRAMVVARPDSQATHRDHDRDTPTTAGVADMAWASWAVWWITEGRLRREVASRRAALSPTVWYP